MKKRNIFMKENDKRMKKWTNTKKKERKNRQNDLSGLEHKLKK